MSTPCLLSTWSFGLRGHAEAWPALAGGGSALDAVERVCCVVEADTEVDSVGIGGLPDREGSMTLDAAIMLAPDRCGAVAAVSRHLHVASIARRVMERTPHVLLVGDGADRFATEEGFEPLDTLLSRDARASFDRWRRHGVSQDRPVDTGGGRLFGDPPSRSPRLSDDPRGHDTIAVIALDGSGVIAAASTTSGLPYKRPGRVGDSPIIGHGLYVDPARGAAVATGSGELVMGQCGSFLAVERMAAGRSPTEAVLDVLRRIAETHTLRPGHQVALIAMSPDGRFGSAALRHGYRTSVTTTTRNESNAPDAVLLDDSVEDSYGQMT